MPRHKEKPEVLQQTSGVLEKIAIAPLAGNLSGLAGLTANGYLQLLSNISDYASQLLSVISGALAAVSMALLSLLDLIATACNKELKQRKTRYATSFATLTIAGVLIPIMLGALVVSPFILPVIFAGVSTIGLYKDYYILKNLRETIAGLREELNRLAPGDANAVGLKNKIKLNEISEKFTKRRRWLHLSSYIAIGLSICGLFFPPVAIAGLTLLFITSVAQVVLGRKEAAEVKKLSGDSSAEKDVAKRVDAGQPYRLLGISPTPPDLANHADNTQSPSNSGTNSPSPLTNELPSEATHRFSPNG